MQCTHFTRHVSGQAWHPYRDVLALCTGAARLCFWSPLGACCLPVPYHGDCIAACAAAPSAAEFSVLAFKWHPEGAHVLLSDKARRLAHMPLITAIQSQLGVCNVATLPALAQPEPQ